MKEKQAVVWFNGYFGTLSKRCVVIGETPKRWRVRWLEEVRSHGIKPGDVTLVPKHAVEFQAANGGMQPTCAATELEPVSEVAADARRADETRNADERR